MEEVRAYYDEKAGSYESPFDSLIFRVLDAITWKYLEPYVPSDAGAFVLDAGGGTGRWAVPMARKGCSVILVDAAKGMLRVAAERIRKEDLRPRIAIEEGDITKTAHRDRSFDLIFCEQAMFLFEKPDILMEEMSESSREGAA